MEMSRHVEWPSDVWTRKPGRAFKMKTQRAFEVWSPGLFAREGQNIGEMEGQSSIFWGVATEGTPQEVLFQATARAVFAYR